MTQKSVLRRTLLGTLFGALIGAGFGAITLSVNGILIGLVIGPLLGAVTGALTAALTVKTAGTTGGVSVGAYTGMAFGAVFGMLIGVLIPTSLRMSANTEGMPVLDALVMGRFESAILTSFLLSILATIVGAWTGGIDFIKPEYDLVVDYKYSLELNSHYRHLAPRAGNEWYVSQNSNYQNWADIMFAWAGIDPESVAPEDKIPIYKVEPEER